MYAMDFDEVSLNTCFGWPRLLSCYDVSWCSGQSTVLGGCPWEPKQTASWQRRTTRWPTNYFINITQQIISLYTFLSNINLYLLAISSSLRRELRLEALCDMPAANKHQPRQHCSNCTLIYNTHTLLAHSGQIKGLTDKLSITFHIWYDIRMILIVTFTHTSMYRVSIMGRFRANVHFGYINYSRRTSCRCRLSAVSNSGQ